MISSYLIINKSLNIVFYNDSDKLKLLKEFIIIYQLLKKKSQSILF